MNLYDTIFENSNIGFIVCKIVLDENKCPIDYEIFQINSIFENMVCISEASLSNMRLSFLIKSTSNFEFDWNMIYSRVVSSKQSFKSKAFLIEGNKTFKTLTYLLKENFIITIFTDITDNIKKQNDYHRISLLSDNFLKISRKEIDYQEILNELLEITEAKFCVLNLFDEEEKLFTTKAIAGKNYLIQKALNTIGIKFINKKWRKDELYTTRNDEGLIFRYSDLQGLSRNFITKNISDFLTSELQLGEIVLFKILSNNVFLGDIAFIMPKGVVFEKDDLIEPFSRQLGLMIERIRAEERIVQSEKRFRMLVSNLDAGVVIHSSQGLIIDANPRASELLGLSIEQLKGKASIDPYWKFINEDGSTIDVSNYPINIILDKNRPLKNKLLGIVKSSDNKIVWVMVNGVPIFNEENDLVEVVISFIDFTSIKYSEIKKTESEKQYRLLATQMQFGLAVYEVILDQDRNVTNFRFVEVNESYERIAKLKGENIIGKTITEVYPKIDKIWIEKFGQVAMNGTPIFIEKYSEELEKYLQISAYSPKLGQFATVINDISSIKKTEEILRNNMNDLIESQRIAKLGTWRLDLSTNEVVWSDELYKMYGFDSSYPPPPYTEHMKLFTEESWVKLSTSLENTRENGVPYTLELETIGKNGKKGWMWVRGEAKRDLDGKIVTLWGAAQDITEYKNIQSELIYLSYHDYLTGLYNRRYFEDWKTKLDSDIFYPLSIIICDVNGLKIINDSFGHDSGDLLLKKVSSILKSVCRKDDILARIGGDEFSILLPRTNSEQTSFIANQIKSLTSKELISNIQISISYGYETKYNNKQVLNEIISNAENNMYKHKLTERGSLRSKTIDLIMNALFEKSKREAMHSYRVGEICEEIAMHLGFNQDDINQLRIAGLIHDIGKIGIDEKILNKSTFLNSEERQEINKHPEIGWRILSSTDEFSKLSIIVLNHHEKWDGSGYPNGLVGEAIPIESRIISVADAYDAMKSERSYRKALSKEDTIKELIKCSGTHFDPKIVDVFVYHILRLRDF